VPPEDGVALKEAVCKLADDGAARVALGRRARAYAQANFDSRAVLAKFFEPIEAPVAGVANNDLVA
jgi:glycosyltransferase involved in cell wall biosynthesis